MRNIRATRLTMPVLICALAIAANLLVILFRSLLWLPLFVDTVFTAAVTFSMGLVPGLVVATLTWAADGFLWRVQPFHPFLLVAIAEVFIVHALKPASPDVARLPQSYASKTDRKMLAIYRIFLRLILIYAACVIAASVLGGIIDLVYHAMLGAERPSYIAINAIMMALMQGGAHELPAGIFSRIQVNMIDRLVVVFGGYLVSRGIARVIEGKQMESQT